LPVLIVMAMAGCESNSLSGKTLYPVKGKVLLPDGKPLTSGQVVFVATKSTITNTANIEGDGGFAFKGAGSEGLPEGEYKIRIEGGSSAVVVKGRGAAQGKLPFDGKFADEDTSGLTATVTADESTHNVEFKLVPGNAAKNAADPRGGR
jgi:hypothetical protein